MLWLAARDKKYKNGIHGGPRYTDLFGFQAKL
jgi:hypothetical protein